MVSTSRRHEEDEEEDNPEDERPMMVTMSGNVLCDMDVKGQTDDKEVISIRDGENSFTEQDQCPKTGMQEADKAETVNLVADR